MYSQINVHLLQKRSLACILFPFQDSHFRISKTSGRRMSGVVKLLFLRDRGDFCLAGWYWGLIFNHTAHPDCREHAVTELKGRKHREGRYQTRSYISHKKKTSFGDLYKYQYLFLNHGEQIHEYMSTNLKSLPLLVVSDKETISDHVRDFKFPDLAFISSTQSF